MSVGSSSHVRSASAWAPLAAPVFRALWIAQFVSNTGTWMQTVGAQWLLLGHGAGHCFR
ncbi:MFS transporter [Streptomyces sp. NPDC019531]|uniref:MFS transporter n=1 Tax=Streptomyces sp. NPDC019531 TaxID=3365062 RepID=UPI00384ED0A1